MKNTAEPMNIQSSIHVQEHASELKIHLKSYRTSAESSKKERERKKKFLEDVSERLRRILSEFLKEAIIREPRKQKKTRGNKKNIIHSAS